MTQTQLWHVGQHMSAAELHLPPLLRALLVGGSVFSRVQSLCYALIYCTANMLQRRSFVCTQRPVRIVLPAVLMQL